MVKKSPVNGIVQCPRCQAVTPYLSKSKQRRKKKNRPIRCHQCGLALTPYLRPETPPPTPQKIDISEPTATPAIPRPVADNPYPSQETQRQSTSLSQFVFAVGSIILLIVLGAQLLWAKKDSLLGDPDI